MSANHPRVRKNQSSAPSDAKTFSPTISGPAYAYNLKFSALGLNTAQKLWWTTASKTAVKGKIDLI